MLIILPGDAEDVIFELNLEGGMRILRIIAEWGTISCTEKKMGENKNFEGLEKCISVAGVSGADDGRPRTES